jgi:hypothetical protein
MKQSTLDTLQSHFERFPTSLSDVNMALMDDCEQSIAELVTLGNKHKKSNMLMQFVLSRKTQSLIDAAESNFTGAIAKLHLSIAVTQIGVNLRIDENVSLLMVRTSHALAAATLHTAHFISALVDKIVVFFRFISLHNASLCKHRIQNILFNLCIIFVTCNIGCY